MQLSQEECGRSRKSLRTALHLLWTQILLPRDGWLIKPPRLPPCISPNLYCAAGQAKTRSRSHACSFYLPWMKPGTDSLWMALVPQERELHTELWGLGLEEESFTNKRAKTAMLDKGHSCFLLPEQNGHIRGVFIKKKGQFVCFF